MNLYMSVRARALVCMCISACAVRVYMCMYTCMLICGKVYVHEVMCVMMCANV